MTSHFKRFSLFVRTKWNSSSLKQLTSAIWLHGTETGTWLIFTLLGALIPVWGGFLLLRLFQRTQFINFYGNGEFALYSAALLAPALYLVVKNHKSTLFTYRPLFALLCFLGLAVSLILFSGVTAAKTISEQHELIKTDDLFLRKSTIYLFFASVAVTFLITAIDSYRSLPLDIQDARKNEQAKLVSEFEELENSNDE